MTSLKTSIKTITYLSDTGCLEIQGGSLIVDNEFLRIGFCIAWTAYYFLSLFKYFVKYFFPLDREDLLKLMDLAKDSPDAKQELLERLLSEKRMTGRDEMDIKRILKTKEALDNIRNFIDK